VNLRNVVIGAHVAGLLDAWLDCSTPVDISGTVLDEMRLIRVLKRLADCRAVRMTQEIDQHVTQEIVGMLPAGVGALRKRHRS
jgi:hypothetical protein